MNSPKERPLSDLERGVLLKLLAAEFRGRDEVKEQIKDCLAIPADDPDNYGSIYLKTNSQHRALVTSRVPVEGIARDKDGAEIVVILHLTDGFVNELEFVRSDGLPMLGPVDPAKMSVEAR